MGNATYVQQQLKDRNIFTIPSEAIGCVLYDESTREKDMIEKAKKTNRNACLYSVEQKRWYVVKSPYDEMKIIDQEDVLNIPTNEPVDEDDELTIIDQQNVPNIRAAKPLSEALARQQRRCAQVNNIFEKSLLMHDDNLSTIAGNLVSLRRLACNPKDLHPRLAAVLEENDEIVWKPNNNKVFVRICERALSISRLKNECGEMEITGKVKIPVMLHKLKSNTCHVFAILLYNDVASHLNQIDTYYRDLDSHNSNKIDLENRKEKLFQMLLHKGRNRIFLINLDFDTKPSTGHSFCLVRIDNVYYVFQSSQMEFTFEQAYRIRVLYKQNPLLFNINEFIELMSRKQSDQNLLTSLFWSPSAKIINMYWRSAHLAEWVNSNKRKE